MSCNQFQQENDADTLFSVGRRLLKGNCVEQDIQRAKELLIRAAELGHRRAHELLASIKAQEPAQSPEDRTEWNKMRSGQLYAWSDPVIDNRRYCHLSIVIMGMDYIWGRESLSIITACSWMPAISP